MKRTAIAWTDWSSNPIKYRDKASGKVVWACVKVADECRNCYAEELGARWAKGHPFTRPNLGLVEPFLDDTEIRTLLRSPLIAGMRLFLGDMTDICGDWVPDAWLDRIFAVFAIRRDVTWQILTKRPARLARYTNDPATPGRIANTIGVMLSDSTRPWLQVPLREACAFPWPLLNVIGGTSAGSDRTAHLFMPDLLAARLAYRSVSAEPLIGALDLVPWLAWQDSNGEPWAPRGAIHWVMVGGESGPGYRPMELDWLRKVVGDCREAGVPVFVKQDSHRLPGQRGQIPSDLWVQEFPALATGAAS